MCPPGSVVSYEALHAHPELRPDLFLTQGSLHPAPTVHVLNGIALDHTTVVSPHYRFHHAENYLRSATAAATVAPYLDR